MHREQEQTEKTEENAVSLGGRSVPSSVNILRSIRLSFFRPSAIHSSSDSTAKFAGKRRETRRLGVSLRPLRFITFWMSQRLKNQRQKN
jgi:hypothetical protein